ncbi:MAG TPA: ABC transporter permease, partial [Flavisolibacter sp.]|nr:ABC transporter permease [Flavisolibacter sp.]
MSKTWIIIKREYGSRVRKKSFILSTLLMPVLFIGLIAAITIITVKSIKEEKIAVVDGGGILKSSLENSKTVKYDFTDGTDTSNFVKKGYSAVLFAPN